MQIDHVAAAGLGMQFIDVLRDQPERREARLQGRVYRVQCLQTVRHVLPVRH